MQAPPIRLVECPRDAMQGWKHIIPTQQKIDYINSLLQVGFDTIDFGSFVSAAAIPQMADSAEVATHLQKKSNTKLLAIVANLRGAEDACKHENIDCLGFPFSVSETFQQRNTNSSILVSLERVKAIRELSARHSKQLVIYISMGFGNPYGDAWSPELVFGWIDKLIALDIQTISLADTVGLASPEQVFTLTEHVISHLPDREIGVHLHATSAGLEAKLEAAFRAGCRRFDGALRGIGGCPMAGDELVGNMDTEKMLAFFEARNLLPTLDMEALQECSRMAAKIFA
jgi:hydroxymethylglutaryl-CoA lyase